MPHNKIYDIYKDMMPFYEEKTKCWFPCGHNTIRVRLEYGKEFIFSYHSKDRWMFETVDSYISKMRKGEQK